MTHQIENPKCPVDLQEETWKYSIVKDGRRYVVVHGPFEIGRTWTLRGAHRVVRSNRRSEAPDEVVWSEYERSANG